MTKNTQKAAAPATSKKAPAQKTSKEGLSDLARAAIRKILDKAGAKFDDASGQYASYFFGSGPAPSELVLLNDPIENPVEFVSGSVKLEAWNGKAAIVFAKAIEVGAILGRGPEQPATPEEAHDDRPQAEQLIIELRKAGAERIDLVPEICQAPEQAAPAKPELVVVRDEAPAGEGGVQAVAAAADAKAPAKAPTKSSAKPAAAPAPSEAPAAPAPRSLPEAEKLDDAQRQALERMVAESLASLGLRTRRALLEFAGRTGLLSREESEPAAERGPRPEGVLDVLSQLVQRPEGCTQKEAHAELVRRFPDRGADSMLNTVKVQLGGKGPKAAARLAHDRKLAITAKEDEARGGLVYTGKPLTQ